MCRAAPRIPTRKNEAWREEWRRHPTRRRPCPRHCPGLARVPCQYTIIRLAYTAAGSKIEPGCSKLATTPVRRNVTLLHFLYVKTRCGAFCSRQKGGRAALIRGLVVLHARVSSCFRQASFSWCYNILHYMYLATRRLLSQFLLLRLSLIILMFPPLPRRRRRRRQQPPPISIIVTRQVNHLMRDWPRSSSGSDAGRGVVLPPCGCSVPSGYRQLLLRGHRRCCAHDASRRAPGRRCRRRRPSLHLLRARHRGCGRSGGWRRRGRPRLQLPPRRRRSGTLRLPQLQL